MPGARRDTGALIAIESGDRRSRALLDETRTIGGEIVVPAGVVAQAWRGGSGQARLARFQRLAMVAVVALDEPDARAAGALCAQANTSDVIDASVVICARSRDHAVISSDPDDLAVLDPTLRVMAL